MSNYIYGLDFGTTNSALSIIDTRTNEVVKTFSDASVIFFPEPKTRNRDLKYWVGKAAIQAYVDSEMKGRFMKSIKRILPREGFKETRVHGKRFMAEDLVSIILKFLKSQADDYVGEIVTKAVFGRPVVFDKVPRKDALAQKRLLKAAKLSGFEEVFFQMEPIAAAFTYERRISNETLVLVADLGGGTSDFTLMRLNPARANELDRSKDMIAKGGIYIGGDNFDSALMWEKGTHHFGRNLTYLDFETTVKVPLRFYKSICSWEEMNFFNSRKMRNALQKFYFLTGNHPRFKNLITLIEENLGYSIFQAIEQTKIQLSNKETAIFEFEQKDIQIKEAITIEAFSNEIVVKDIKKIEEYLLEFLKQENIQPADIQTVFMTGGTSLVKPVQGIIERHFGREKMKSGDNFNSVANGLAYSSTVFFQ